MPEDFELVEMVAGEDLRKGEVVIREYLDQDRFQAVRYHRQSSRQPYGIASADTTKGETAQIIKVLVGKTRSEAQVGPTPDQNALLRQYFALKGVITDTDLLLGELRRQRQMLRMACIRSFGGHKQFEKAFADYQSELRAAFGPGKEEQNRCQLIYRY